MVWTEEQSSLTGNILSSRGGSSCTVRKYNWWHFCLAPLCDEIFDYFPLFDETLLYIELCNSVIRHIQWNPPKLFQQCVLHGVASGQNNEASQAWNWNHFSNCWQFIGQRNFLAHFIYRADADIPQPASSRGYD